MRVSPRLVSALMFGVSTFFLARYVQCAVKQQKHATKKLAKQAVHDWEGEGGNIIEAAPRSVAG